jgi:hypothetical protein
VAESRLLYALEWRYGSDGKVAYLTLISPATGKALTLRREFFGRLPRAFIQRVQGLLNPVAVPTDQQQLLTFKGWVKAMFEVVHLKAFKAAFDEQQRANGEEARA